MKLGCDLGDGLRTALVMNSHSTFQQQTRLTVEMIDMSNNIKNTTNVTAAVTAQSLGPLM